MEGYVCSPRRRGYQAKSRYILPHDGSARHHLESHVIAMVVAAGEPVARLGSGDARDPEPKGCPSSKRTCGPGCSTVLPAHSLERFRDHHRGAEAERAASEWT